MAATITLTQLISEFGTYIGTNQKDILKLLTQKTKSQEYMTTVVSKDLEYRASKAVIDDMVQGFQKAWTTKGTPAFTPISIPQRRHKFDLEFYPDEVFETWLGFLTDETKDRKSWPITKYIIEQLIMPKIADNRELKLIGLGNYAAVQEGVAQATGLSMDGFITILNDLKDASDTDVNWITPSEGTITDSNAVDWFNEFADSIGSLYQGVPMNIFCSARNFRRYSRKEKELYGVNPAFTYGSAKIDGTPFTIVPLPSIGNRDNVFATPKENFIRLINGNDGASNIAVENVDRKIKIYGDWHESVGFGIKEAIFAFAPNQASASA